MVCFGDVSCETRRRGFVELVLGVGVSWVGVLLFLSESIVLFFLAWFFF